MFIKWIFALIKYDIYISRELSCVTCIFVCMHARLHVYLCSNHSSHTAQSVSLLFDLRPSTRIVCIVWHYINQVEVKMPFSLKFQPHQIHLEQIRRENLYNCYGCSFSIQIHEYIVIEAYQSN